MMGAFEDVKPSGEGARYPYGRGGPVSLPPEGNGGSTPVLGDLIAGEARVATVKNDRRFYVYVKFRPWDGSPCYVGKGQGNRAWQHEKRRQNLHLSNIIRKAEGEIPTIILKDDLLEQEAYDLEAVFIKAIGREDNGGRLVNLTDGGDGIIKTPQIRAKISAAAKKQWAEGRAYKYTPELLEQRRLSTKKCWAEGRGPKFTPELKAKISASLKRCCERPEYLAHLRSIAGNMKGKKRSPANG